MDEQEWEVDNETKGVMRTQNSWNTERNFKNFQPWHLWSSRGTRTLWHRHLGSLAGHSLDPKTPARVPLQRTPVDCLHLSDKDIQTHSVLIHIQSQAFNHLYLYSDSNMILIHKVNRLVNCKWISFIQVQFYTEEKLFLRTAQASLPPSLWPAHIILRVSMPGYDFSHSCSPTTGTSAHWRWNGMNTAGENAELFGHICNQCKNYFL